MKRKRAWELGSLGAWELGSLGAWELGSLGAWELGSLDCEIIELSNIGGFHRNKTYWATSDFYRSTLLFTESNCQSILCSFLKRFCKEI